MLRDAPVKQRWARFALHTYGATELERRLQNRTRIVRRHRPRLLDGQRRHLAGGVVDPGRIEADVAQALRDRELPHHVGKRAGRVVVSERIDKAGAGFRRGREIETGHMRQDDRMRLGMRQAEASQNMCELVMQAGAGGQQGNPLERAGPTSGADRGRTRPIADPGRGWRD